MWKLTPFKIVCIYILLGVAWITTSDLLMETMTTDPRTITLLSIIKGWLFIVMTAIVLYGLMRRYAAGRTRAEEAARASGQKYRALIETTGTGFVILDGNGRVRDANEEYVRLTGHRMLQEILGRSMVEWTAAHDRERNVQEVQRCLELGFLQNLEIDYARPSGAVLPVEMNATVIEVKGSYQILSIVRDITERRKAQGALRESEEKYRALVEAANSVILTWDTTGKILFLNDYAERFFGFRKEELTGRNVVGTIVPQEESSGRDLQRLMEAIQKDPDRFEDNENENITKGGRRVWVRWANKAIVDKDGQVTGILSVGNDITERKKAEAALLLFTNLLDRSNDAIFVNDPASGRFLMVNDRACSNLGYDREVLLTKRTLDIEATLTDPAAWDAHVREVKNKGHLLLEGTHRRSDGTLFPVEVNVTYLMLSGADYMVAVARDVSERRSSERALRISEERLSNAQKLTHVGNWEWNIVTNELYWSEEVYRIYGLDPVRFTPTFDAVGKSMHPDDRERFLRAVHAAIYERQPFEMDYRLIRPDGSVRTVYTIGSVTYDAEGKPQIKSGTIQDITERKKMEEALRSSRDFIERILDTVDEAFIVIDRDYRVILANKAYGIQANMPVEEIIGKHCYEVSHQSSMPCFEEGEECSVHACFASGQPHTCIHRHTAKDGGVLYVETKAFPLKDCVGNVTSAIEVINNITDKHLLEEQMLRTQKLEAVGLLAGGIAHDFNNLLQAVFGSISLGKMFTDKDSKAHAMLDEAEAAMYQATNLTKQLLTFSKGGEPVKRLVALPVLLEQAVKFALSGSNVSSAVASSEDLWTVEADEGQLNQVIHNIVLNACESMPGGGRVRVDVRNMTIDDRSGVPLPKGRYVRIGIMDTGTGIAEQNLDKIFDPYFTTKQGGSGLGLATSYSIIRKHGGVITASSKPGDGSTFSIYLPATALAYEPATAVESPLITGRGRILVMDDEEVVRRVAGLMISGLGYDVDFAENGHEAVQKYTGARDAGKRFDAVILDLTVRGGMGGGETLRKLADIDPSVRAIVSSGYSADDIVARYRDHGFLAVLSKPYQLDQLGRVLQDVLCS